MKEAAGSLLTLGLFSKVPEGGSSFRPQGGEQGVYLDLHKDLQRFELSCTSAVCI